MVEAAEDDEAWLSTVLGRPVAEPRPELPTPVPLPKVKRRHSSWRLNNKLFSYRFARGMTKTELAKRVGVSRRTIGSIENRTHEPVLSLGLAIAEALEASVDQLFQLERPSFNKHDRRR